jgi:hypothetical protein
MELSDIADSLAQHARLFKVWVESLSREDLLRPATYASPKSGRHFEDAREALEYLRPRAVYPEEIEDKAAEYEGSELAEEALDDDDADELQEDGVEAEEAGLLGHDQDDTEGFQDNLGDTEEAGLLNDDEQEEEVVGNEVDGEEGEQ